MQKASIKSLKLEILKYLRNLHKDVQNFPIYQLGLKKII
jgi:hypothetical protein